MKANKISVVHVLELVGLNPRTSTETLRAALANLVFTLRIVGELQNLPALVIESSIDAAQLRDLLPPALPAEVVELRSHFPNVPLRTDDLQRLIVDCVKEKCAVVGSSAVERAMQRRNLDLLVIASDAQESYRQALRRMIETHGYHGPLTVCELTQAELGNTVRLRRAGCIGLLRGRRYVLP